MSFYKPSPKITRTCDNCKCLLRKADAVDNLRFNGIPTKYNQLCKKCFDLWLEGELDE